MGKRLLNDDSTVNSMQALRRHAEEVVSSKGVPSAKSLETLSPEEVRSLLHELQVHQIELEMQNEELRRTQLQLEAARARYFDLYDLAPVGYCTVSELGIIVETNMAAAALLGEVRSDLVGQRISRYIVKDYQDVFYLCCKRLFSTGERQACELHMVNSEGVTFWVDLAVTVAQDDSGALVQRIMLNDITNAKTMAMAMKESESRYRALVSSH